MATIRTDDPDCGARARDDRLARDALRDRPAPERRRLRSSPCCTTPTATEAELRGARRARGRQSAAAHVRAAGQQGRRPAASRWSHACRSTPRYALARMALTGHPVVGRTVRGHQGARRARPGGARRRPGLDRPPRLVRAGRGGAAARATNASRSTGSSRRRARRTASAPGTTCTPGNPIGLANTRCAPAAAALVAQRARRPPRDRGLVGRSGDRGGPLPRCRRSARALGSGRGRPHVRADTRRPSTGSGCCAVRRTSPGAHGGPCSSSSCGRASSARWSCLTPEDAATEVTMRMLRARVPRAREVGSRRARSPKRVPRVALAEREGLPAAGGVRRARVGNARDQGRELGAMAHQVDRGGAPRRPRRCRGHERRQSVHRAADGGRNGAVRAARRRDDRASTLAIGNRTGEVQFRKNLLLARFHIEDALEETVDIGRPLADAAAEPSPARPHRVAFRPRVR